MTSAPAAKSYPANIEDGAITWCQALVPSARKLCAAGLWRVSLSTLIAQDRLARAMWKLRVLCALSWAVSAATAQEWRVPSLTHYLEINETKTVIIPYREFAWDPDSLYSITVNDTHIHYYGMDMNNRTFNDRLIKLDPKDRINGRIQGRAGSHTIVLWGVNTTDIVEGFRRTHYTVLLIYPRNLIRGYKAFALPPDGVPSSYPSLPLHMFAYVDRIKFFLPSLKKCAPCEFDYGGNRIESIGQIRTDAAPPTMPFLLWSNDVSDVPYIYVSNFPNRSSIIKYLRRDYSDYRKSFDRLPRLLNHTMDVLAATVSGKGVNTYINFCYGVGSPLVYCGQFNEFFELRYLKPLPLIDDHYAHRVSLQLSADGQLIVTVVQTPKQKDRAHRLISYVFDKEGHVRRTFDFGKIDRKYQYIELDSQYFNSPYFCLYTTEMKKPGTIDSHQVVRCTKYASLIL
ncbi:uncharacterized protein LOC131666342 isoform X2 [Phymastichus coffea]|uniref:uncharacterized protein LOC131666342 isoform X2 n=1 Tax=Phymastichus coffea TaxID=108790 RepID=UPI00273ABD03|nr:uncharacterized protein LOC131666342 isoform X2 [Phymastichus coffea]